MQSNEGRIIKFRALSNGKLYQTQVINFRGKTALIDVDGWAIPQWCKVEEFVQYTGLKDKKTLTDIYEGDIIDMEGNIRGNIYESPEVYKALTTCVVAGMGYEDWENTKQRLVRQGKLIAEQSNLPQILRELG